MITEQITVDIDGTEHIIYRDEILRCGDKAFKDTFIVREATYEDLKNAEKRVHQLRHALSSMDNTLQHATVRYITSKYKTSDANESNESNDEETTQNG